MSCRSSIPKDNHRHPRETTSPTNMARLLDLPPEIRNKIWSLAIPPSRVHVGYKAGVQPAISSTNRLIRKETLPMFYARTIFTLCVEHLYHRWQVEKWIKAIGESNVRHIRVVKIATEVGRIRVCATVQGWQYSFLRNPNIHSRRLDDREAVEKAIRLLFKHCCRVHKDPPATHALKMAVKGTRDFWDCVYDPTWWENGRPRLGFLRDVVMMLWDILRHPRAGHRSEPNEDKCRVARGSDTAWEDDCERLCHDMGLVSLGRNKYY